MTTPPTRSRPVAGRRKPASSPNSSADRAGRQGDQGQRQGQHTLAGRSQEDHAHGPRAAGRLGVLRPAAGSKPALRHHQAVQEGSSQARGAAAENLGAVAPRRGSWRFRPAAPG